MTPQKDAIDKYEEQAAIKSLMKDNGQQQAGEDELLNFRELHRALRKSLLGRRVEYKTDDDGNPIVKDGRVQIEKVTYGDEKLCNEQAVESIMATITGTVNKNMAGSFFHHKDIEEAGRLLMWSIIMKIRENHEQWDIDNIGDAEQIRAIVHANLKAAIKKSAGGKYLDYKSSSTVRRILQREDESGSRIPLVGD